MQKAIAQNNLNTPACTRSAGSQTFKLGAWGGIYTFSFTGSPTNPCASAPSFPTFWMDGKLLSGSTFSVPTTSAGSTVPCSYTFSPSSPPVWNPYSQTWQTAGSATPTGNPSSTGSTSQAGDWSDANGKPVDPQPTTTDPTDTTIPNVCDGGSCYDPSTDQYCSTSGGQQYCVSGAEARSTSGGCATGPSSVMCAGSPNAPVPSTAQQSQTGVTDPATQARTTDSYQQANPTTGASQNVNVTTYAAPGQSTSSGQKPGDAGPSNGNQSTNPAHPSSAGGNGSDSGGTDCNTPPLCTGDAVLCGTQRSNWASTCQVHTDLAGDGTGQAKLDAAAAANDPSNAWVSTAPSSGNATADNANNGIYDTSGFGYATQCPMQDLTVPFGNGEFIVPFSKGCVIGPWIAGIIQAFALFTAARITMGSSK